MEKQMNANNEAEELWLSLSLSAASGVWRAGTEGLCGDVLHLQGPFSSLEPTGSCFPTFW